MQVSCFSLITLFCFLCTSAHAEHLNISGAISVRKLKQTRLAPRVSKGRHQCFPRVSIHALDELSNGLCYCQCRYRCSFLVYFFRLVLRSTTSLNTYYSVFLLRLGSLVSRFHLMFSVSAATLLLSSLDYSLPSHYYLSISDEYYC